MNKTNTMLDIYEPTWIGLLQAKVTSINNIQELIDWSERLQKNNLNLPSNVNDLLSYYQSLSHQKDRIFTQVETDEAKLILLKNYLSEKTIGFFPTESDENLRQKYISKFIAAIPKFAEEWNDDVDFREGDNSLVMLFVFLNGSILNYDEKTLVNIFEIIDSALIDTNEIVQAEVVRGLLINVILEGLEKSKYAKYMQERTFLFCKKINSIWQGETLLA